jgi:hypothetical protein
MPLSQSFLHKKQNICVIAKCYEKSVFGIRFAIGYALPENKTASRFGDTRQITQPH